jgi:hypothetical protein
VGFILYSMADGSRRPGSWERQMLQSIGLVAECEEHQQYWVNFGNPEK